MSFLLKKNNSCIVINAKNIFDGFNIISTEQNIYILNDAIVDREKISNSFLCKQINASSLWILPGLIDTHTHLFLKSKTDVFDWKSMMTENISFEDEVRLEFAKANARSMLLSGFTTVRDLGNSGNFLDFQLAKYLSTAAEKGPRFLYSGPGLAAYPTQLGIKNSEYRIIENKTDVETAINENKNFSAGWLKIYADNEPSTGQLSSELLKEAVTLAQQNGLKVSIHAETDKSTYHSLLTTADSIEHFYKIPTSSGPFNKTYVVLNEIRDQVDWLKKQNLPIVFGSDAVNSNPAQRGQVALNALIKFQKQGFTPLQALITATSQAAEMLGYNDFGVLKIGKKADLIITSGNPLLQLEDLRKIRYVIKDGVIVQELSDGS